MLEQSAWDVSCVLTLCHPSAVASHMQDCSYGLGLGSRVFIHLQLCLEAIAQTCGTVLAAHMPGRFQVLLVDQTSGLVAGSCAERMGGHGTIVLAHTGDYQLGFIKCCHQHRSSSSCSQAGCTLLAPT